MCTSYKDLPGYELPIGQDVNKYLLLKSIQNDNNAYGINEDESVQKMEAISLEVKESPV